ELGAGVGDQPAFGEALELTAEDLPGRGDDRPTVGPLQVAHDQDGSLVPWDRPNRVEVGLHLEVAVAGSPRRHLVALDRVHVDVDGEQVVAALGAVMSDLVKEMARGQALAL